MRMKGPHGDERFWTSTRGRIVLLLRRGSRAVNELAGELGLTSNAVRTHLIALGRDGLVRASGMRPGSRKPNTIYDLTPEADHLFPKVYGPLLHHLVDILKKRMPPADLEEVLRTVGHRMAAEYRPAVPADGLRDRAELAVSVLGSLGGLAELEGGDGKFVIRSFDCPLAVAAAGHPEVCRLVETLLAGVIDVAVHQRCQTEPMPQCYFEVGAADP
jgi:predicted ArsR family transcriptional regulator